VGNCLALGVGNYLTFDIAQLLAGEGIKYPHVEGMDATFKRAPKAAKAEAPHPELPLGD